MYNDRILEFKRNIIAYLNEKKSEEDDHEPIDILDVFKYDGKRSLKLTHYGYRNLKDEYTFYEMEFPFENNILNNNALDRLMTRPYYFTLDKSKKHGRLLTTDKRFMKRFKLSKYDLNLFAQKFHSTLYNDH